MSLSEQCNPEIRPVENRTVAPVNTEPEESKGEAVDFNEQATRDFKDSTRKGERGGWAGCRRMGLERQL